MTYSDYRNILRSIPTQPQVQCASGDQVVALQVIIQRLGLRWMPFLRESSNITTTSRLTRWLMLL